MGAGHSNHPALRQHDISQHLWTRGIAQAAVEHFFHRRIAPTHGIADHHQIRSRIKLGSVVAFMNLDTGGTQLV